MSKLIYNADGVLSVTKQLSNCSNMLDSTRREIVSKINIIKNAHGANYISADYGSAIRIPTEEQDQIDKLVDELTKKAKIIEDYSNNLNGVSGLERAGYTVGLFFLKFTEGLIGDGEEIIDGVACGIGFLAGAFGNTSFRDRTMNFVAKDHVGDAFARQYEEGGMFANVNKYSYFDADSSAANVCKTAGSITGYILLTKGVGGAVGKATGKAATEAVVKVGTKEAAKTAAKTAIKSGSKEATIDVAKNAAKTLAKETVEKTTKKSGIEIAGKVVDKGLSVSGSTGGSMQTNLQSGKTAGQAFKSSLKSVAKGQVTGKVLGKTGDVTGNAIKKLGTKEASAVATDVSNKVAPKVESKIEQALERLETKEGDIAAKTTAKTTTEVETKAEQAMEKALEKETSAVADKAGNVTSESIKNSTKAKKLYDASTDTDDNDDNK